MLVKADSRAVTAMAVRQSVAPHRDADRLVRLVRAAGLVWAVAFVVIGLACDLQLYADGSLFSYAIALEDSWSFHWRNIAGRLFVHLFSHVPAEAYVALTGDARAAITIYGLLFFSAPLLGLGATWLADRSERRSLFTAACTSTALLCPLVFGFPTEMWFAHSLFWPTLALAHFPRRGLLGASTLLAAMLALMLTHEGALILALAIIATLLLRGYWHETLLRASAALVVAIMIWMSVELFLPPDDYYKQIVPLVALSFFDVSILADDLLLLLVSAVVGYFLTYVALRRAAPDAAHRYAALLVSAALAIYWFGLDQSLHASERYPFRMLLLLVSPVIALLAAASIITPDLAGGRPAQLFIAVVSALRRSIAPRCLVGALAVIMLVHGVETVKFCTAWREYVAAVRMIASGPMSDAGREAQRFVSSERIPDDLDRLSWRSTTPYLSVLVAPGFRTGRLVVDADAGYYWLSCRMAAQSEAADAAIPKQSRHLIRVHSCQHRPDRRVTEGGRGGAPRAALGH